MLSSWPAAGCGCRHQSVRNHLGAQNLRRAIARKFHAWQKVEIDPVREVTVCCGSTEAMIATLLALVDPGKEVIVFEPFYENYGPDAIFSGSKCHSPSASSGG